METQGKTSIDERYDELDDCRFCGEKPVIGGGFDHFYISCSKCACSTPETSTFEEAKSLWNKMVVKNVQNSTDELPLTPYENLKSSVNGLLCLACALCKTRACEKQGLGKCSGIVDATEALMETPRNCEISRSFGNAVERFMKEDFARDFPKNVVDWNWNHMNRFILWLFEKKN